MTPRPARRCRPRSHAGEVVAGALGMSENTLRNHLTVIYSKLNVQGKLNLYVYAVERGLAPPPTQLARPSIQPTQAVHLPQGEAPHAAGCLPEGPTCKPATTAMVDASTIR